MTFSLRIAADDDYPALHGILQLCGEHMHRVYGLSHWYPYRALDVFRAETQQADVYAIHDDAYVIGTFYLTANPRPYYTPQLWQQPDASALYVGSFGVLPPMQGRGAGSWAMQCIEAITQAKGYAAVRLDTVSAYAPSVAFYDELGYRRCGLAAKKKAGTPPVMVYEKYV